MRKLILLAVGLLTFTMGMTTLADVRFKVQMGFPAVLPPLVEVQPGVRVVQDFDEEVFFTGGYYWVQRDGNWYRARDHRGTWSYVKSGRVPVALVHHQPGQYRRWQHDERKTWPDARHSRGDARHWQPQDHREWRQPEGRPQERGHGRDRDR